MNEILAFALFVLFQIFILLVQFIKDPVKELVRFSCLMNDGVPYNKRYF